MEDIPDASDPMPKSASLFSLAGLCPLVFLLALVAGYCVMVGYIAVRKGRNPVLWALLAIIPIVSIATLWLISLTDKSVLQRLGDLESRLAPPS